MWYEIERNLNSFIISNTGSKDLYLTLFLSEKCDIDVNYKVCIEEVIIKVGDSYTFNLPIKDGLYKLLLTDKEGNYQEIFIPQYLELLSSLVEDINYVLCGCNYKDCDDCDNCDGDAEILSVLLKILSYISINKNKYEKALASSNACVECDILESNLCTLINENVSENYQNKNLIKKLIALYYLVFYYTDYKIENNLETIQQRYNFKKIYPCIKKIGLSIECIEDNWNKGFENISTIRRVYQGESVRFQLNFHSGTDLSITDFTAFDSIKVEVQTVNYPIQEVAVEVEALAIKGIIPTTVTANLFGNVLVFLTFTKGVEVWKNKVTTGLYIDKL